MANEVKENSILDTVINIEPTGVVYNLTNEVTEEFLGEYLDKKKVDGVTAIRMQVLNEGMIKPDVALYMFINQNSSCIESSANSVPPLLKGKMDKISVRLKDDFKKILYPIVGSEDVETIKAEGREFCIKLDIFRVIGLMLAVDPSKHRLTITDAKKLPGNGSIITVMKGVSYNFNRGNQTDRYARQIGYFEKRH